MKYQSNIELNFIKPDSIYISYTERNNIYKHSYARLMPFLLSKCRKIMHDILRPYEDTVIRLHTDGCLFSEEPKNIQCGLELGDLVFEAYYEHITINQSGIVKYE